ncbi:MAG: DUF4406 domain-containing protein [Candidatus Thorarchaeota archaeon]|nr:DUF4406 domain-containing protein [Candidatus Thorarchaeota archaeon]
MKSMKIYVAGPYTGQTKEEIEENVRKAMEAGLRIWKKGHFPYIPHLTHWPDILAKELGIDMDWPDYMNWHAPWVDHCDALFLLAESKGALLELNRVKEQGKTVFHTLEEIPTVDRSLTWAHEYVNEK